MQAAFTPKLSLNRNQMDNLEKDKEALSWLTRAWDDYTGNFPLLLPVLLTQAALSAGSFYIIGRYHSLPAAMPYIFFVLTPVATGLNLVYIKIARGGGARYLDLFSAFPVYHRALAVSLGLGFMTMGGALLLIVPGIIIYLTYCFSEYAVVDRRTGVKESFELSASITEGWKSRLFVIFTLIMLVNVLVPDIYVVTGGLNAGELPVRINHGGGRYHPGYGLSGGQGLVEGLRAL